MYIDQINLQNFRTFEKKMQKPLEFLHPDKNFTSYGNSVPKLKNINLLLGDNGSGKTSILKAIALTALGPAVGRSGIFPYRLVRIHSKNEKNKQPAPTLLDANFVSHEQDDVPYPIIESAVEVVREGDLEYLEWVHKDEKVWHPVFSDRSEAMFIVGYGCNRRIEKPERSKGDKRSSERAKRIMSLFEEEYTLRPLNTWLPNLAHENKQQYAEVIAIIDKLLGKGTFEFTGELDTNEEYVFDQKGVKIPFPALSDGYRAYLGWLSDLLYHVVSTNNDNRPLVENRGIVLVDEIDLHLHPKWQMRALPDLSKCLPNLQFIATSHSPLVVGSLESVNIIALNRSGSTTRPKQNEESVFGLDADQILLTSLFGLKSTRSKVQQKSLLNLSQQAASGDEESAKELLRQLARGKRAQK